MANFIPRKKGYVVRDAKQKVVGVICVWNKLFFPFYLNPEGKAVRADWGKKNRPYILDDQEYGEMIRQANGIFTGSRSTANDQTEEKKTINPALRRNATERDRLYLLGRYKIYILENGCVQINRNHIYRGKTTVIPNNFIDINAAIRSRDHLLEAYLKTEVGEIYTNSEIAQIIDDINMALLQWTELAVGEKIALENNLTLLIQLLDRLRNDFKVATLEQLKKIPGFKDLLGRINPSAMAARTIKAGRNIEKRINQIEEVIPFAITQKAALEREKLEIMSNILSVKVILKALINSLAIWKQIPNVDKKLGQALFFLQSVWANPFRSAAQEACLMLVEAKKNINQSIDLAKADITIALAILS